MDEVLTPEAAAASFAEALERNSEALTQLRAALAKHSAVAAVLERHDLLPETVVAMDVPEEGSVVYVRRGV